MSETTTIDNADYGTLAAKLQELTLTPGEAAALAQVLDHAAAHTSEVTGFAFEPAEEDEVSGFSFSFGNNTAIGAPMMQLHTLSQFGNVSGGYNNQFGSQWISEY